MKGSSVIEHLATRFPVLYVAPAEDAEEAWIQAMQRGKAPSQASLTHFVTNPEDELREVETPAGPVEVVYFKRREDFETFLQVIGHRSEPTPIAPTIGAMTYRGLPDWGAVAKAYCSYVLSGGNDWHSEFARLAKEPGAFRAELIVISEGPYSNVPASETPYDEDEWLRISREIRLHHECAHVVCRRLMQDDILPVWDEITADVTGLLCATGSYDTALAGRFLGVTANGFEGGRLEEYLDDAQKERIDDLAAEIHSVLLHIENSCGKEEAADPFAFLLSLKKSPLLEF